MTVAEAAHPFLGDWSPEGVILFTDVGRQAALFRGPAGGGEPARVTSPARGDSHLWPSFLPGGRTFLYQRAWGKGATIHVGALVGAESRPLLTANSQAVYVASGHVLFVRGRALLAQPMDGRTLRLNDAPFAVAENPRLPTAAGRRPRAGLVGPNRSTCGNRGARRAVAGSRPLARRWPPRGHERGLA